MGTRSADPSREAEAAKLARNSWDFMMDLTTWQTSSRDLLIVVFKRRWSVLTIVLGGLLGVLFWMFFIRGEVYEVTAKVLVKIGHEQSNPSAVGAPPILITGERSQDVNSEVDILQSTDLLQAFVDHFRLDQPAPPKPPPPRLVARMRYEIRKVVRLVRTWKDNVLIKLGFKDQLSPREAVLAELSRRLGVTPERNSNVITVRLRVEQRQDSSVLLNKLLDLYITFRLRIYGGRGTEEFFHREVETRSTSLRQAEQELRSFEEKWNISAIEKQKEVLLDQIAAAQTTLTDAEIGLRETADRVRRAEAVMKSDEPDVAAVGAFPANSFPAAVLAELAALQREREHLRMTELDSGMRIRNNRKQFQVLMEMVSAHLKSALAEKQATGEKRKEVLADFQKKVRELKDREAEWSAFKRKVRVSEDSYLAYRKKMEDATATGSLEAQNIGSVAVLEHALDPVVPVGMSKIRILGLTLILTLFAAVAWLSVTEYLDHRIYTAEDLEKHLASPVLEVVPVVKRRARLASRSGSLPTGEAYRRVAWALANPAGPTPLSSVFFSSATRGEGATTALLAVSRHLSKDHGLKTLVLELDRTHPLSEDQSVLDPECTLEAYAAGKLSADQCIRQHESGVFFLPVLSSTGHRLLDPSQLRRLLEEVRPGFAVALVDAPPISTPDSLPILSVIKNAVLVVESGRTRYEMLEPVKRQLAAENVSLAGVILNKHKRYVPGWIYRWLLG